MAFEHFFRFPFVVQFYLLPKAVLRQRLSKKLSAAALLGWSTTSFSIIAKGIDNTRPENSSKVCRLRGNPGSRRTR